jgi:insertion element IS1 protein InsB
VKVDYSYWNNRLTIAEPLICLPISVEADEQWSFVGKKANQRWLWVVLGHHTQNIIAYCFGPRTDAMLKKLLKLLKPLNIVHWFTDGLAAYQRLIDEKLLEVGKRNTQKIERMFLTFRARIKRLSRKTICFSKSTLMHDTVIGLFINREHFGRNV